MRLPATRACLRCLGAVLREKKASPLENELTALTELTNLSRPGFSAASGGAKKTRPQSKQTSETSKTTKTSPRVLLPRPRPHQKKNIRLSECTAETAETAKTPPDRDRGEGGGLSASARLRRVGRCFMGATHRRHGLPLVQIHKGTIHAQPPHALP